MHDEAVDAVAVADVVRDLRLALEVGGPVARDEDAHAVDDVVLRALAVAALPRAAVDLALPAGGVVAADEVPHGRVVPGVVLVVVGDLVHVPVDNVAGDEHLDALLVVDVLGRRQHHGALSGRRPPGVAVDDVAVDGHVVGVCHADARGGAVVHDEPVEVDVVPGQDRDAAAPEMLLAVEALGKGLRVRDTLAGPHDLQV
mmetsp:Transcript_67143/g.178820  ORF Transcript_67143/g.178820 Transcript_67143/m.178820 type:complete len:200 (-) Transcript_67143:720-1319(-)